MCTKSSINNKGQCGSHCRMPTYSLNNVQKKPYFLSICKATPATVKTVAEALRTSRLIDVNVIFVIVLDGFLKQGTMDILILTTLIGLLPFVSYSC